MVELPSLDGSANPSELGEHPAHRAAAANKPHLPR
jgi:hypothetical protein